MYKKTKPSKTTIQQRDVRTGERIEQKVNRIVNNKEPIKDQAPLNYTERKDGVNPDYDIRADKWERALNIMEEVNKSKLAQRTKTKDIGGQAKEGMEKEKLTEIKPIQGTDATGTPEG